LLTGPLPTDWAWGRPLAGEEGFAERKDLGESGARSSDPMEETESKEERRPPGFFFFLLPMDRGRGKGYRYDKKI
tara:strand:- start:560 stop:784 length:225 start_codon:yes stop_codon:yes gene_type:complete